MIGFKQFISEDVIGKFDKDELIIVEDILESIKKNKLQSKQVMFRGMNTKDYVSEVTNDRTGFYGSAMENTKLIISKNLGIKNPTFITTNEIQASMFGAVKIFIPSTKSTFFGNPTISDIMADTGREGYDTEEARQKVADGYTKSNSILSDRKYKEVLVDTKKYYLFDYLGFIKYTFKNRSKYKPKERIESLTYGDIYDTLNAYLGLEKWKIQKGHRKSFEDSQKDAKKQSDRLTELRKERSSEKQLSIRLDIMIKHLNDLDVDDFTVDERNFTVDFKSQKRAKEVWKEVKKGIENRMNQMKVTNLGEIKFLDGVIEKNKIRIK